VGRKDKKTKGKDRKEKKRQERKSKQRKGQKRKEKKRKGKARKQKEWLEKKGLHLLALIKKSPRVRYIGLPSGACLSACCYATVQLKRVSADADGVMVWIQP